MTVYYQFGSKRGLLEALFDDLGGRHFRSELPSVMSEQDPHKALAALVDVFYRFWSAERLVTRRIRAMAALDREFEESIRGRDERRRGLLRTVLERVVDRHGKPSKESFDSVLDALYALTSFATFDNLAAEDQTAEDVLPPIQKLARLALQLNGPPLDGP
jgi:AcrR family transcriptional regulator